MEDADIVELLFARSETGLGEAGRKYGRYCLSIARNILGTEEDAEECFSDALNRLWDTVPPKKPERLSVYMGILTRSIALDRYRAGKSEKRGGGELPACIDELEIAAENGGGSPEREAENGELKDALESFLLTLSQRERMIFLRRYWYASPIPEIAEDYRMTEVNVRVTLHRTKKKLEKYLKERGIWI